MLYVYAVAYYCTDYVLSSIRSLRRSTSREFNLTVAENRSENSHLLRNALEREVYAGNIDAYIVFDDNLLSSAVKHAYRLNPPKADSEDFVVFTDLDLKVPDNLDWIKELRERFAYPEVGLVAFDLDPINYEPRLKAVFRRMAMKLGAPLPSPLARRLRSLPDMWPLRGHNWGQLFPCGHSVDHVYQIYRGLYSGMWLCGVRRSIVDRFVDAHDTFLDRHLNRFAQSLGFVIGRIPLMLYHHGWDAWKDYPGYYAHKLSILHEFHNEARQLSSYEVITHAGTTAAAGILER